jgi:hypothetical protein
MIVYDKEIKKLIGTEEITYMGNIIKINKTEEEPNILLLTNQKLYNLKSKKNVKSKISISTIIGLTKSSQSDEFIIHIEKMKMIFIIKVKIKEK